MRLWTLHPMYLDVYGLNALWREGLCGQKALIAKKGYYNHPQLDRFKRSAKPLSKLANYLSEVEIEAFKRGYKYDRTKLAPRSHKGQKLTVTTGQLHYEAALLNFKLEDRRNDGLISDLEWDFFQESIRRYGIRPHPMFREIPGEVESWEKARQDVYWT